ncbi:MAG TPA: S9 family peptidase [Ktedonobacterales bacterium]|nr:S9 family peptidase [Ktedonobacterales bacterium]
MPDPTVAPYGSWKSPITSAAIVAGTTGLSGIVLDGADVYWKETRPAEGGRLVLMRQTPDGAITQVTPPDYNVRTTVHEYGGVSYTVHSGVIYFSNFRDQRLYRQRPGEEPAPITPEAKLRYADGVVDERRNRMICVREDHRESDLHPINTLVTVDLRGDDAGGSILVSGNDFYASPRLSPDGSALCWLTWNHPNMPWDGTELWVAQVQADGTLANARRVAGGADESIAQPEWSPDGVLHFVSDRSNWWNLYRLTPNGEVEPLHPMDAEFTAPQWSFGQSSYQFESGASIICAYTQNGLWYLGRLNTATGAFSTFDLPYTAIGELAVGGGSAYFPAGSPTMFRALARLDLASGATEVVKRSSDLAIDPGYISPAQPISFPTEQGREAYALYYPPINRDYTGPAGEKPPLLVHSHGGPTSATNGVLNLSMQYWTSRGIAVVDVNYGGSTGYGREYRQRLNGQWGVVDVDDCVNAAKYLVDQGLADGDRLMIAGGSAGGYTTLCALTFRDVFKAGASHFGISDLEILDSDSHKFESRYNHSMIGPYPERKDLYVARSPIHFTDQISCPVILFQGLDDKVVTPNQAEMIVEALRRKGLPVAYLAFEGEGHGFRKAENIRRSLDGELYFYARVFGFPLGEPVEPVEIENLA